MGFRQEEKMKRKPSEKPYWEMNEEELREATKEFDEEFVADQAKPLSPSSRQGGNAQKLGLPTPRTGRIK
jgi:hypothetical protein